MKKILLMNSVEINALVLLLLIGYLTTIPEIKSTMMTFVFMLFTTILLTWLLIN